MRGNIEPFSRAEMIFQASQSHQLAPFVKATGHKLCPFVEYDCNMDIFWGESSIRTNMASFLENTEDFELFGIPLHKLTPEAEFIALCMHHYKDLNSIYLLWSRGFDRRKLEEIGRYVRVVRMDTRKLYSLCEQYDARDYVCWCVHFAGMLESDASLQSLENTLTSPAAQALYDCLGLNEKERKRWNISFKERCCSDIRESMYLLLTEADRKKINTNLHMM